MDGQGEGEDAQGANHPFLGGGEVGTGAAGGGRRHGGDDEAAALALRRQFEAAAQRKPAKFPCLICFTRNFPNRGTRALTPNGMSPHYESAHGPFARTRHVLSALLVRISSEMEPKGTLISHTFTRELRKNTIESPELAAKAGFKTGYSKQSYHTEGALMVSEDKRQSGVCDKSENLVNSMQSSDPSNCVIETQNVVDGRLDKKEAGSMDLQSKVHVKNESSESLTNKAAPSDMTSDVCGKAEVVGIRSAIHNRQIRQVAFQKEVTT